MTTHRWLCPTIDFCKFHLILIRDDPSPPLVILRPFVWANGLRAMIVLVLMRCIICFSICIGMTGPFSRAVLELRCFLLWFMFVIRLQHTSFVALYLLKRQLMLLYTATLDSWFNQSLTFTTSVASYAGLNISTMLSMVVICSVNFCSRILATFPFYRQSRAPRIKVLFNARSSA